MSINIGVCYYPEHWDESRWELDIQQMKDIGISVVRMAEFTWGLVEKTEGTYDFSLLKRSLDLLKKHNMDVIMCTPTAAPPPWLIKKYPEIVKYTQPHHKRTNGTRRNYSFSSKKYQELCKKIVTEFAINFKDYDNIIAWQIDNEYDTMEFSPPAIEGFREWLKRKYKTLDNLNEQWGSKFWSIIYRDWDEIEHVHSRALNVNPSHFLDYYRYHSYTVEYFNKIQVDILREHYNVPMLHNNCAGSFPFYDQFELMNDLDIMGADSYPLGWYSSEVASNPAGYDDKSQQRRGNYKNQGLSFDLSRCVGNGDFWITENQPGPINWGAHNHIPQDGFARLWALEGIAHGGTSIIAFRWRQAQSSFEQYHNGLLLSNGEIAQGGKEYKIVAEDMKKLLDNGYTNKFESEVAIIYDYQSFWAQMIQPHGDGGHNLAMKKYYGALTELGVNVDFISTKHDLSSYKVVILAQNTLVNDDLIKSLESFKGQIIINPRTFSRTQNMHIPEENIPYGISNLIDVSICQVESMPATINESDTFTYNNNEYCYSYFREQLTTKDKIIGKYTSDFRTNAPAIIQNDQITYVSCIAEDKFYTDLLKDIFTKSHVKHLDKELPNHVKMTTVNKFIFVLNYGGETVDLAGYLPAEYKVIIGDDKNFQSGDVLVIKIN